MSVRCEKPFAVLSVIVVVVVVSLQPFKTSQSWRSFVTAESIPGGRSSKNGHSGSWEWVVKRIIILWDLYFWKQIGGDVGMTAFILEKLHFSSARVSKCCTCFQQMKTKNCSRCVIRKQKQACFSCNMTLWFQRWTECCNWGSWSKTIAMWQQREEHFLGIVNLFL